MKNQIVKKKRFQLAFASLPKEYHYYVKETNELTICRDCKRWHFEIAGANVTYQKAEIKKVTIFVWDNTQSYRMAVLNAVPDRAIQRSASATGLPCSVSQPLFCHCRYRF